LTEHENKNLCCPLAATMPLDSNIVFTTMHYLLARFAACCPEA